MYYEFHTKYDYDSKFCMWAFSYLRCFRSRYLFGSSFIITGMLFDFLDGMVARKLDSVSEIGGELDSFADLVTFGVAPSILAYSASLKRFAVYRDDMRAHLQYLRHASACKI